MSGYDYRVKHIGTVVQLKGGILVYIIQVFLGSAHGRTDGLPGVFGFVFTRNYATLNKIDNSTRANLGM